MVRVCDGARPARPRPGEMNKIHVSLTRNGNLLSRLMVSAIVDDILYLNTSQDRFRALSSLSELDLVRSVRCESPQNTVFRVCRKARNQPGPDIS